MVKSKPSQVALTGYSDDVKHAESAAGDIYLYTRDDYAGRLNRRSGHTNLGYSGFFLALIFDGTSWRHLKIDEFVDYSSRSYQFAHQIPVVRERLRTELQKFRAIVVDYDPATRRFKKNSAGSTTVNR